MDRTRAIIIASIALTAMALAGHAIRASEPASDAALGLAGVVIGEGTRSFVDEPLEADFLDVLRAREVLFRTYDPHADEPVWLFLGYFDRQKEGSQVHSPRHCYPGSGWNIERELRLPAPWGEGEVPALVVDNGAERRLVCFWYQLPSGIVDDVFRLKVALTRRAVMRAPQDVVFVSVSAPMGLGEEQAAQRVLAVARDVEAELTRLYAERERAGT
jgi:EpsI family protein